MVAEEDPISQGFSQRIPRMWTPSALLSHSTGGKPPSSSCFHRLWEVVYLSAVVTLAVALCLVHPRRLVRWVSPRKERGDTGLHSNAMCSLCVHYALADGRSPDRAKYSSILYQKNRPMDSLFLGPFVIKKCILFLQIAELFDKWLIPKNGITTYTIYRCLLQFVKETRRWTDLP